MMRISKLLNFIALMLALVLFSVAAAQETYVYDKLGRLIQVDYEDGQVAKYNYDAAGNRTLVQMGGGPDAQNDAANAGEDTPQDIDVLANDSDLNGDTLTISNAGSPPNGSAQVINVNSVDWIRYTPNLNFNGVDTFTYTVTDGTSSATADVIVTVLANNDPPNAVNDTISTNEDTTTVFDPRGNDTDPEGQTLTITVSGNGANGAVVILNGGTQLQYTPNANFSGSDSFVYTVSDGALTDAATVNVTVNPVNDAPVAVNDSLSTSEDTAKTIDPRTNDTDAEGQTLTITSKTNGSKGSVAIVTSGTQVLYTPNANQNGSDSFTYTISDGNGGTDTATVSVSITAVNDPPNAVNDSKSTNEDVVLIFDPRTNDIEPDGQSLTITSKTNGAKGAVAILNSGTQLRYTPNANQNGSDSFTYTISDGSATDTATVSITINSVNDAPNAVNDTYSGVNNMTWTTLNVRGNDSDIDSGSFTVSSTSGGAGEIQIINSSTQVRYRCLSGCGSDDLFTYAISDGSLTDTATVTLFLTSGGGGGGLPLF